MQKSYDVMTQTRMTLNGLVLLSLSGHPAKLQEDTKWHAGRCC
jgi:hypothetical protein